MPRPDRLRLALALTLVLCGLQKAEAQMPAPTAPALPDQAPLLPGSTPSAPDSDGTGLGTDPFSRFDPASADPFRNSGSSNPPAAGGARRQGRGASGRTPQGDTPGATQQAFGSTKDFSSELGVNDLLGPNGPSFQPLSVTDYRLLDARRGAERTDRFGLRRSAAADRFRLIAPANRAGAGDGAAIAGRGMGWPALRPSCPDDAGSSGAAEPDGCPG